MLEAYGIKGYRINTIDEARAIFEEALNSDEPVVIDCRVKQLENVYPMVAAGKALDEMVGVKKP